jgi:hypothetical protein
MMTSERVSDEFRLSANELRGAHSTLAFELHAGNTEQAIPGLDINAVGAVPGHNDAGHTFRAGEYLSFQDLELFALPGTVAARPGVVGAHLAADDLSRLFPVDKSCFLADAG